MNNRHMQTSDITHMVVDGPSVKINKHDRRKLRNHAYNLIKQNTKGRVPKGLIKQAAFNRSQKAFAEMAEIKPCKGCGLRFQTPNLEAGLCTSCRSPKQS